MNLLQWSTLLCVSVAVYMVCISYSVYFYGLFLYSSLIFICVAWLEIICRPGQSHGLLYKHLRDTLNQWWFVKISLCRRHALMVEDCNFSHKIGYVKNFKEIINPEGHPNRVTDLQRSRQFCWIGEFGMLVELHQEGFARSLRSRLVCASVTVI